jgi:mannose-6-phosphate isomerase-like protein (cupin superfamily)
MQPRIDFNELRSGELPPYTPVIVGEFNGHKLCLARIKGPFVWHKHDDTDDVFIVLSGRMTLQLRDGDVELAAGQGYIVPVGVEHCPTAGEPCDVLLIERIGTVNTGDAGGPLTRPERR